MPVAPLANRASCFNPRSRVGSDARGWRSWKSRPVSIHAPAWGATALPVRSFPAARRFNPRSRVGSDDCQRFFERLLEVSIHAPAWGATGVATFPGRPKSSFNPRSRVGSDDDPIKAAALELAVSIHAPAWGATPFVFLPLSTAKAFQSTLPRGERRWTRCLPRRRNRFNPRSRVGSDAGVLGRRYAIRRFNPRSRVGSDLMRQLPWCDALPFQSTLPRGERLGFGGRHGVLTNVSIHAPAWGATPV